MAKNQVPGTYKSKATFESKTSPLPKVRDLALKDTRVLDEEYDYTTSEWPGKVHKDPNLSRAEGMHVKH